MSIITDDLVVNLSQSWIKLKVALSNFQQSPLEALLAVHEFINARNEYFFGIGKICTAEDTREIISHFATHLPLELNKDALIRLEMLNVGLSESYCRKLKAGDWRFYGEHNILSADYAGIIATLSRIVSVNIAITQINPSEIQKDFITTDLLIGEELLKVLERKHYKLLTELNDLIISQRLLLIARHRHCSRYDTTADAMLNLAKKRMLEILNTIWTGPNRSYFINAYDENPKFRQLLLDCQNRFIMLNARKNETYQFQKSADYKLRLAKLNTLKLIQSKRYLIQSSENKALLKQVETKTLSARTLAEINQQLDEIKTRYKPRDQIFTLVHFIRRLFSAQTLPENTGTYKAATRIQQRFMT